MQYRLKNAAVHAMQCPDRRDQALFREVAVWMADLGYRESDQEDYEANPESYDVSCRYGDILLAEHGVNYLTVRWDNDGWEREALARQGDWIVKVGTQFRVMPNADFWDTYEEDRAQ